MTRCIAEAWRNIKETEELEYRGEWDRREAEGQPRAIGPEGHVMEWGQDEKRHRHSQQAWPVLQQSLWLGPLLAPAGCFHLEDPRLLQVFVSWAKVGHSLPSCHALALLCIFHQACCSRLYVCKMRKAQICRTQTVKVTLKNYSHVVCVQKP